MLEKFATGVRSQDERRSRVESRGLDNFSCPPSRKLEGYVLTI